MRCRLARIIWALIVSGQPYDEKKAFAITEASTARRLKNLQHQAQALNMTLVPAQGPSPSQARHDGLGPRAGAALLLE